MSSTAARFMLGSSRTAVCGHAPVSTPTMHSSSRTPLSVRRTCFASSVVTTSLVMINTLIPRSSKRGVMASTIAVLPEPTGPPMPIRVIFLAIRDSTHEQAYVCVGVHGRQDLKQWSKPRHIGQPRRGSDLVRSFCAFVQFEEDGLRLDVAHLHEPQRGTQDRRGNRRLVHDERVER